MRCGVSRLETILVVSNNFLHSTLVVYSLFKTSFSKSVLEELVGLLVYGSVGTCGLYLVSGTQWLGVYKYGRLGTPGWGSLVFHTVKYAHESRRARTREWPRSNCERQTRPLVREGAPTSTNPQRFDSNKNLILGPRWVIETKTKWPTDRRP
jgi:hypothetical protein